MSDGRENLIPTSQRSKEEARELGRVGGIRSGVVRREKKRMSEIYAAVLAKKYDVKIIDGVETDITGADVIEDVIHAIISRQDSASVAMIKELREGIDGNKLDLSATVDLTTLTDEEYEAKKADWLKRNASLLQDEPRSSES